MNLCHCSEFPPQENLDEGTAPNSDSIHYTYFSVYGGIYLDWDEIILQPVDDLRKHDYVQVRSNVERLGYGAESRSKA